MSEAGRRADARTSLLSWRLRHPLRTFRAALPDLLPLRLRAAAVQVLRREKTPGVSPWGDPAAWLEEIRLRPRVDSLGAKPPLVSIHVIAHGNAQLTELCVEGLSRLTTDATTFEVIVFVNGRDDATSDRLRACAFDDHVRIVTSDENLGFARACNRAVAASRGEVVCLLNNDVVVSPGWLDALVDELRRDAGTGMAGPVTNACGNEARVDGRYRSLDDMLATASARRRAHEGEAFEIPMLAFYCVAMWRRVWEEIGPLDERFEIGMFEDDDYARRLRAGGYSLACREDAFVHHWGAAAFAALGTKRYFEIYARNRRLFRDKWRR